MKPRTIRVAIFRPLEPPTFKDIPDDLRTMQRVVDGYIEMVRISDDGLVVICNEEGKLHDLPFNRMITRLPIPELEPGGEIARWVDRLVGTFLVCRVRDGDGDMYSITPEDELTLKGWKPSGVWDMQLGRVYTEAEVK